MIGARVRWFSELDRRHWLIGEPVLETRDTLTALPQRRLKRLALSRRRLQLCGQGFDLPVAFEQCRVTLLEQGFERCNARVQIARFIAQPDEFRRLLLEFQFHRDALLLRLLHIECTLRKRRAFGLEFDQPPFECRALRIRFNEVHLRGGQCLAQRFEVGRSFGALALLCVDVLFECRALLRCLHELRLQCGADRGTFVMRSGEFVFEGRSFFSMMSRREANSVSCAAIAANCSVSADFCDCSSACAASRRWILFRRRRGNLDFSRALRVELPFQRNKPQRLGIALSDNAFEFRAVTVDFFAAKPQRRRNFVACSTATASNCFAAVAICCSSFASSAVSAIPRSSSDCDSASRSEVIALSRAAVSTSSASLRCDAASSDAFSVRSCSSSVRCSAASDTSADTDASSSATRASRSAINASRSVIEASYAARIASFSSSIAPCLGERHIARSQR